MDCKEDSLRELLHILLGDDRQETTGSNRNDPPADLDNALGYNDSFKLNQRRLSKKNTSKCLRDTLCVWGDDGSEAIASSYVTKKVNSLNDRRKGSDCNISPKESKMIVSYLIPTKR